MRDESELYYSVERAKFVRAGLLTPAELRKRILDDGGSLSQDEKTRLKNAWDSYLENLKKYKELLTIELEKRTDKEKAEIVELESLIKKDEDTIKEFEILEFTLFEETADAKARNKTIFWWCLMLAMEIKDGKPVPFFGEGEYADKMRRYEEFEEEPNKFAIEVTTKFNQLLSMWYAGKANTKEEFEGVQEWYKKQENKIG